MSREFTRADEVELEVAVTIGKSLPPIGRDYEPGEIEDAIGSLHLGFEVVGSRFENRQIVPPLLAIADNQSNEGVLLGAPLDNVAGVDLAGLALRLVIDGVEVATSGQGASLSDVVGQLTWLANHVAGRIGGLRTGDIVMTGARIGPVSIADAAMVEGTGQPFASISLTLDSSRIVPHMLKTGR
jgi:2-keto-4-pentenoate hydratase